MRNLASIKTISQLLPIKGKDRIVLAIIDGWNVIVKKDEFSVGDQCVYIEIDSVLPEKPEFEFLRSKGFRIKTMKLGETISQGICFPLSILPPGDYKVGQDVTDIIGVRQYNGTMDLDPELQPVKNAKRKYPSFLMRMKWFRRLVLPKKQNLGFPSFISKTDEIRIQNIPFVLKDRERRWLPTEKIDGQSGTFALVRHKRKIPFLKDRFEYIVCSRNRRLLVQDNSSYWSVSARYDIPSALKGMIKGAPWIAIQGECVGPKIQKNKYQLNSYDLYVFNVLTPQGRLPSIGARALCEAFGLKFVPILDEMTLPPTVAEVLSFAHGKSQLADVDREGIVFRSPDGKDSFKAVDPLFLLQYDE